MNTIRIALCAVFLGTSSPSGPQSDVKAVKHSRTADCPCYQLIEKTIYVPQIAYETRTIKCVECRPQIEEYIVTCQKTVIEHKMEKRKETIKVPENRYRIQCYTIQKPQFEEKTECYMKSIPTKITWEGTETVVKEVPEKITRVIKEDNGHWEERCCQTCCKCKKKHCSCPKTVTRRVWIPNITIRTEEDTITKKVTKEVPRTYTKTCYKMVPATRTKKCFTCYKTETIENKVAYTENVCREVTREVPVVVKKTVPVKKTKTRTVMVPHTVEKEITVPVCKLVPKTITCKVPTLSTCLDSCRKFCKGCGK